MSARLTTLQVAYAVTLRRRVLDTASYGGGYLTQQPYGGGYLTQHLSYSQDWHYLALYSHPSILPHGVLKWFTVFNANDTVYDNKVIILQQN